MAQTIFRADTMKSKDVYWEVRFPFFCSQVLGVAPMNEKFGLSKIHLLYTLFTLSVLSAVAMYLGIFMESTKDLFEMSAFSLLLERAQLFIVILSVLVSAIKSILNVRTISGVMKNISHLDRKLYEVGIYFPYSRIYGCVLASVRLCLILSIALSDVLVFKTGSKVQYLLAQYVMSGPILVGNIVQVQFMVLLEAVQRRMRVMIDKLKDIRGGDDFVKVNHLHALVSIHSSLLSICEVLNCLYSPQILIILSSIFIVNTANLYHVIEKLILFIQMKKYSDLNFLCITSYRVVVRSLEVWTLVTTCVNTQEVAQEFNTMLYQAMIDDKSNDIVTNKKLRLHISMKRDVVFTACGFFTLDYTLVHSMIAAATTYLVILIQFGLTNNNDNDNPMNQISNTTVTPFPDGSLTTVLMS